MAAFPVTDELYPPALFTRFTTYPRTLHTTDAPNGAYPGLQAQYLPCQLIVEAEAADVVEVTDLRGVASAITFAVAGVYVLRLAPVMLTANTTAAAVTVCWPQKG